jgi:hypothetical protein
MASRKLNRTHTKYRTIPVGDSHQHNKHQRAIPFNARLINGVLVRHAWLLSRDGSGPLFWDKSEAIARQASAGGELVFVAA